MSNDFFSFSNRGSVSINHSRNSLSVRYVTIANEMNLVLLAIISSPYLLTSVYELLTAPSWYPMNPRIPSAVLTYSLPQRHRGRCRASGPQLAFVRQVPNLPLRRCTLTNPLD